MNVLSLQPYDTSRCPRCDVQVPFKDISVDEDRRAVFRYQCKCGLKWTKLTKLPLSLPELWEVSLQTRRLHVGPRPKR